MSASASRVIRSAVWGLLLMLAGLAHQTVVMHYEVKPHFEPYASYFLEARGWPAAWLVTERSGGKIPLSARERFLASRFLVCWLGASALAWLGLAVFSGRRRFFGRL